MPGALIIRDEPTAEGASYTQHAYVRALAELIASGALAGLEKRPYRLQVLHGEGCGLFEGRLCDCCPELTLQEEHQ